MTTPWAHLPNAAHIDAVLADVKARPKVWASARVLAIPWITAWNSAWVETKGLRREVARNAAWSAAKNTSNSIGAEAAWGLIHALIAWDDSAALLDQPPDVLRAMIDLVDGPVRHQATLLLPYAIVRFGT